jgi:hypothetical protein
VIGEWSKKLARKTGRSRAFIIGSILSACRCLRALYAVTSALTWKESHLVALLILASFVALILVYELYTRGWDFWPIAGFSLGCYVLAWIIFQIVGPNLPVETDSEIYLVPGNKPTPDAPCNHISQTTLPMGGIAFLVGSNEFWSSRSGETDVITLDGKPVVSMKRSDRGLLFDVEMFDLNKRLVAKITNNKSILVPKNYSYKEHLPHGSTLALSDDYDKEILYVDYLNDKTILIRGVFTGPKGTTIVVDDNQILRSIKESGVSQNCWGDMPKGYSVSGNESRS